MALVKIKDSRSAADVLVCKGRSVSSRSSCLCCQFSQSGAWTGWFVALRRIDRRRQRQSVLGAVTQRRRPFESAL
jgi:hypothetical protein